MFDILGDMPANTNDSRQFSTEAKLQGTNYKRRQRRGEKYWQGLAGGPYDRFSKPVFFDEKLEAIKALGIPVHAYCVPESRPIWKVINGLNKKVGN